MKLAALVDKQQFALFCTPVINLFEHRIDRLEINPGLSEFHLVPDRSRPMDLEVFSVQGSMGVGPVLRHWPARRPFAGTYNDAWAKTRAPLAPLDVQPQYWQVAPKAQQAKGHLKGGEKVMLQGVTPPGFAEFGVIQATLPRLSLGFRTKFYDGSVANTRSVIHSVILQPDGYQGSGPIISVVHHMHLPCHALVNKLDTTTIIEKRRPLDKTQALSGQNEKQDLEPDWEKSWV